MELIILQDGAELKVDVQRVRGGYDVEVDGRSFHVDHAHPAGRLHSLIIDGHQSEVSVEPAGPGAYLVSSDRGEERIEARDPLAHLAETEGGAGAGAGKGTVTAYMPGRVVTLLAAEGDAVTVGQGVVVLEAMKMENEISSELDGIVTQIHVSEGQSVEGGDPLFDVGTE